MKIGRKIDGKKMGSTRGSLFHFLALNLLAFIPSSILQNRDNSTDAPASNWT